MGELRYSQTSKDHSALILFLLRRFSKKHYLTHSQVIPYMLHIVHFIINYVFKKSASCLRA